MASRVPTTSAHRISPRRTIRVLGWIVCCSLEFTAGAFTAEAYADELWIGSTGATGAIQIKGATITRIESGTVYFMAGGKETSRELAKVQRISVDGETALNAAEQAYLTGDFSAAVDGYQRTVRATNRPWLKDWATMRLIDAASKSGRFDAAVTSYLAMLLKDPAAAGPLKPAMPDPRSTYLDTAVTEVTGALATKGITDEQRQALLTFLMDLHRARRDPAAEEKVAAQLDEILAKDPNHPAAAQAIARRKLLAASRALENKDYRTVIAEVDAARDKITEPHQQADALFYLAEARHGLADAKNPEGLKDAALAYMRVVAHFKGLPDAPHVAPSLLRVAQIHEQLGEIAVATNLYEQVVNQFKDDPAAQIARQSLARLGQASTSGG